MDCQDWTPVVVKNKRRATAAVGGAGSTATGVRTAVSAGAAAMRRVEADEIAKPTKSLSAESRAEIIRRRTENTQTQAQLNTACSFPPNTIRDIEAGKLCPTGAQLNVLNRVLKTALKYSS